MVGPKAGHLPPGCFPWIGTYRAMFSGFEGNVSTPVEIKLATFKSSNVDHTSGYPVQRVTLVWRNDVNRIGFSMKQSSNFKNRWLVCVVTTSWWIQRRHILVLEYGNRLAEPGRLSQSLRLPHLRRHPLLYLLVIL